MASSGAVSPDDLPLFDVSTHDLYKLAHGLVESDTDHEFCQRLFKELGKCKDMLTERKVGRGGQKGGGGSRWGGETFSVSWSFGAFVRVKDKFARIGSFTYE